MSPLDIRWLQRFDNFKRAFARLREASELADQQGLSDLERQGLIQAFEFTHELAWNTFKDFLSARGSSAKLYGSRDATRAAFAAELIEDGEAWMKMIEHRTNRPTPIMTTWPKRSWRRCKRFMFRRLKPLNGGFWFWKRRSWHEPRPARDRRGTHPALRSDLV